MGVVINFPTYNNQRCYKQNTIKANGDIGIVLTVINSELKRINYEIDKIKFTRNIDNTMLLFWIDAKNIFLKMKDELKNEESFLVVNDLTGNQLSYLLSAVDVYLFNIYLNDTVSDATKNNLKYMHTVLATLYNSKKRIDAETVDTKFVYVMR